MTWPHPIVPTPVLAVDLMAAAVQACPSVAGLHGGQFGEVATYLPGRRVLGVRITDTAVDVHVTGWFPATMLQIAAQIRAAVTPWAGGLPVDVTIEDMLVPGEAQIPAREVPHEVVAPELPVRTPEPVRPPPDPIEPPAADTAIVTATENAAGVSVQVVAGEGTSQATVFVEVLADPGAPTVIRVGPADPDPADPDPVDAASADHEPIDLDVKESRT